MRASFSGASCTSSGSSRPSPAVSGCCWAGGGRVSVSAEVAAAVLLIAVPIAFNAAVFELGRAFDYPNILREGPDAEASRRTIELIFATLHRLLGVGIGEHLGYLLTGLWTLLVAASILSTAVLPGWLGVVGVPIGIALLVGTLEFVGPNEKDGWPLAGTIVPIAYVASALWLLLL